MEIRAFRVLAECSDVRTGKRFGIGDTFDPPPTVEQAMRLVSAGCLPDAALATAALIEDTTGVDPAAIARAQLNHDGLFDKSMDELRQIVADEGVEPSEDEMKGLVIDAIRRQRTSRAAQLPAANVQMRTEAGELSARQADALAAGTGAVEETVTGDGSGVTAPEIGAGSTSHVGDGAGDDGLDGMTPTRLRDIAETEKLDLGTISRKADIVAAIRAHRAKA